ncbi:MAG: RNA methyltransferase [Chloroflexi bacterium]|nr:RNA methyltransferase [Chloroflexota bacterium]
MEQKCFVLEGVRLIEEAMLTGVQPDLLLFSSESTRTLALVEKAKGCGSETEEVKPSVLESVSDTQTSQGLVGIFRIPSLPVPASPDFVLILDGVSDPGNLGTILRTASAAGVQLMILTPGTADVFAPKVVRSAMGAHFYLPIRLLDWTEINALKQNANQQLHFLASTMTGGKSCWESDLKRPIAILIGSEASGISSQAAQLSDEQIHIPMQGKIESLNASTAASILIFEAIRQRTT